MKSKSLMLAGLAVGMSTLATSAMAQVTEGYSGHHQMWGHGGGWSTGGHFFIPVLGVILVIVIVLVLARVMGCRGMRCGHHGRSGSAALATLEERYAKGEIDKAEFEERKNTLTS